MYEAWRRLATHRLRTVETDGAGPSVLLVHSSGGSATHWRRLQVALAGRRTIAVDLLGSGENPPWPRPKPFHPDDDVAVLHAIVDGEPGEVHVVGHSYGGVLATRLAVERADRVRRLVAHEPVLWGLLRSAGSDEDRARFDALLDANGFLDPDLAGTDEWMRRFFGFWSGEGAWEAMPEVARARFRVVAWKVAQESRALLTEGAAWPWHQLAAPPRITVGRDTPALERRVVQLLAAVVPGTVVQVVDGGHMAPLTHPDGVLPLFVDWLR